MMNKENNTYWQSNIKLIFCCLIVWFTVSFGAGILFVEPLNRISLGGYPLGFWFAQQGAIYCFVGLIIFYNWRIKKLDSQYSSKNISK